MAPAQPDPSQIPVETPQPIRRIVLFSLDGLISAAALPRLVERLDGRVVAIVASQRYGGKYGSFQAQFVRNYRRSGWDFLNYLGLLLVWFRPALGMGRVIGRLLGRKDMACSLTALAHAHNIPIIRTREPNEEAVASRLRALEPDLFVSAYFDHIMRAPLIAIPKRGVINIHSSLLPELRGPFPAFWALLRGIQPVGVTVHAIVDEDIDTGPMLLQRPVDHRPDTSVLALDCDLMRAGADLACEAIAALEKGTARFTPQQPGAGSYQSYPSRDDVAALKKTGRRLFTLSDFLRQILGAGQARE